mmetsp:Transcript_18004/g.26266  ORF Transcript_18004/g.26266 Transcript_18004/m.26266 type:complete len:106 (-) Transcript_18004:122-439(-)
MIPSLPPPSNSSAASAIFFTTSTDAKEPSFIALSTSLSNFFILSLIFLVVAQILLLLSQIHPQNNLPLHHSCHHVNVRVPLPITFPASFISILIPFITFTRAIIP